MSDQRLTPQDHRDQLLGVIRLRASQLLSDGPNPSDQSPDQPAPAITAEQRVGYTAAASLLKSEHELAEKYRESAREEARLEAGVKLWRDVIGAGYGDSEPEAVAGDTPRLH